MIELNIDLSYLSKYFEIGTQRINEYSGKSIEEVMELEGKNGNVVAADFSGFLQSPEKVAKLFQLMSPENRFLIIRNLSSDDLQELFQYLEKDDLIWGLRYFTLDKILNLVNELPKEQLKLVVFQNFSMSDILELMPESEMDEFFKNDKVERTDIMKYFESLDQEQLGRIMSEQFGASMREKSTEELIGVMNGLEDDDFTKMLEKMQRKDKMNLIGFMCSQKPELIDQFSNESIARPMKVLEKSEILKSFEVLDNEFLIDMVTQLPEDLMQVVATQIDPNIFAEILVDKFPDVLAQIAI